VAALLGAGAPPLGADEPLMGAGVNSTLAVALTGRLEERLGVALPPTLVGLLSCSLLAERMRSPPFWHSSARAG
jgi:hypothetical protein